MTVKMTNRLVFTPWSSMYSPKFVPSNHESFLQINLRGQYFRKNVVIFKRSPENSSRKNCPQDLSPPQSKNINAKRDFMNSKTFPKSTPTPKWALKDSWVALDVIQRGLWSPTMDVKWRVRHPPGRGVKRFGQETICTLEGDFWANFLIKQQRCVSDHTSLWWSDCRHWPVGVDCSRQLILGRCPLGKPPQLWLPAWAEEWSPQQSLPTTTSQAGRWSA